ncbi:MAG: hypothetical protein FD131_3258 [Rhodocyclaceae bacterium]|nr:MAG: hypothetical protein FD131_3258 [Rhodocyclaceae bacterium]
MRIPVTQSDLDQGHLTKISRALQKLWPQSSLSLMQSQNTLSGLLGYRNLHDLQANTVASIPAPEGGKRPSRADLVHSVAWQAFRRHGMNIAVANEMTSKLHLDTLDIDAITSDADFERLSAQMGVQGKFLVMDEANQLLEPRWNPKTPQILDADIPGYEFAVLANRQVFQWSRLESLLGLLPQDCVARLREEPKYAALVDDSELELRFLMDELYPDSLQPLGQATKESWLRPDMTAPVWLFDASGQCLGRVIHHRSLAGIIPRIYGIDDASIFDAIGTMLCGEIVASEPVSAAQEGDAPVFMLSLGDGYDLAADIRRSQSLNSEKFDTPDPRFLDILEGVTWGQGNGGPILIGARFTEAGQDYVRARTWLNPSDAPIHLLPPEVVPAPIRQSADVGYTDSRDALPEAAYSLQKLTRERIKDLGLAAVGEFASAPGLDALLQRLLVVMEPAAFDRFCDAAINEYLPLRYEGDTEDNPDLISEREDELRNLTWLGEQTLLAAPGLAPYKPSSIGFVLMLAEGEYPGSRHRYAVSAPAPGKSKAVGHLHAYMLLVAAYLTLGLPVPEKTVDAHLVVYAAQLVLSGALTVESLPAACREMMAFLDKLSAQENDIENLKSWRYQEKKRADVRAAGRYLYVGKDIPSKKPEGLAGMFNRMRKWNSPPILATQSVADLQGKLPE